MDRETALTLVDRLGSDEQVWIDYKEDYFIQGSPYHEAEFRKDVQALANADTDHEKRYIIVGCDENEGIVGVELNEESEDDGDRDENSQLDNGDDEVGNLRHILSFDADDLQEKLDGSIRPSPQIALHTYDKDGDIFGVVTVEKVSRVPVVATSTFQSGGNKYLQEGDIWIRKSSGKKRADKDDIENIVQRRLDQRRDYVHEGIRRVVAMDPDTIAEIGSLKPSEEGRADITFEVDEEGDYTVSGEFVHREFSSIKGEFNAEIAKRNRNPDHYIDLHSLMRFYEQLDPPEQFGDAKLLVESSMINWLPGVYWMERMNPDQRNQLLECVPDENSSRHEAAKLLMLIGNEELSQKYIHESDSINNPRFSIPQFESQFAEPLEKRLSHVCSNVRAIDLDGEQIDSENIDLTKDEMKKYMPKFASKWLHSDSNKLQRLCKYGIKNLELRLAVETFIHTDLH